MHSQSWHEGSTLDSLLEADGTLAEVEAAAVKRVLAWQISQTMADAQLSKAEMARAHAHQPGRAGSSARSRQPVGHPAHAVQKAAAALGKRLKVELVGAAS